MPRSGLLPLGPSCPLQTILLSDLIGCGSLLQKVMAVWRTFFKFDACQTTKSNKIARNGHFNLQRAVVPDWMANTAL
jgi:hypothetical protein